MAGRGPDERLGRLARLDRGEVKARLSGFPEERPERRNATSGAPGSARAGLTARGTSQRCQRYVAPNGAPLPLWREEGNEGGAPRPTTSGADESRLWGCLKTESEMKARRCSSYLRPANRFTVSATSTTDGGAPLAPSTSIGPCPIGPVSFGSLPRKIATSGTP